MKRPQFLSLFLCLLFCAPAFVEAQEIDKELSTLADKLAASIKENGNNKVTVLDFTDLHGNPEGELGKYIAEQLTVNLVMTKLGFAVLDRANLKSILAEHKLTATGLVDPENAKKLGQFAGVDAMIIGTIIPKKDTVGLTVKIIATDTTKIVDAERAEFKPDETTQQLMTKPATEAKAGDGVWGTTPEKPSIVKTLDDLKVEFQSLQVVNGGQFLLTVTLTNQNSKKSVWVALGTDLVNSVKGKVMDTSGFEFNSDSRDVDGIATAALQNGTIFKATEIKPKDSVATTVKFYSRPGRKATTGSCTVQLEFLLGYNFSGEYGDATSKSLLVKMDAE